MSILNRLTGRHLDDAALAEIWTATAAGEVITDPHLDRCAECRVRYAAFVAWMDDVRADARHEADEAFPTERLAAQHAQIFRRIEASERPARVIAFPKFTTRGGHHDSPLRRWVAAAAAAGLIVGVGLGSLMDLRHLGEQRARSDSRTAQQTADATPRGINPASVSVSDEMLIQELEAAATPQYEALRAFDTFTPRAADFVTSSR